MAKSPDENYHKQKRTEQAQHSTQLSWKKNHQFYIRIKKSGNEQQ